MQFGVRSGWRERHTALRQRYISAQDVPLGHQRRRSPRSVAALGNSRATCINTQPRAIIWIADIPLPLANTRLSHGVLMLPASKV